MERQTYTCLRSVCSSWRRVATATPGLCTGLEIDIEKWLGYRILSSHDLEELLDAFKDDIDPWLSILSSTSPYHLNLTSGPGFHDDTRFMKDLEREAIVDYLLTTLTSPIFLSTPSSDIFWLIIDSDTYYPSVHYLNLDLFFEVTPSLLRLSEKFPNLENLVVESKYSLADFDTSHPNLRSLTLLDLETLAGDFAPFLGCLPTLRELKISSHEVVSPWPDAPRLTAPITHPTLEIIAIRGEDLILLLEYLVAPSLKFFGIEGWGWDDRESHTLVSMVSHFLERSHPANITVSMRGIFTSSFFNPFTQHLPASASLIHLAGNLKIQDDEDEGDHRLTTSSVLFRSGTPKEIFCRDLRWIKEGVSLAPQNPSINILMPSHPGNEELRSDLESWGYEVKVCSQHDMGRMIRATFPRMSIKWGLREEFS
ncbi:hypothetical protein BKA70DRAFT_1337863 [Coprinopsis sp. MPI-PUGE-AT-0042]|nr:hypothetical protein BKA70DRAFT_1337863 [Coprinopsis sp. MPI-PUGE-AT-0042]